MRIISGTARGRKLLVPGQVARPTTDRVRGALFSILGDVIADAKVLDLYAGSGALGIESISRGAAAVSFVDSSKAACAVMRKNLASTGFEKQARVINREVAEALPGMGGGFDLVFADPPYDSGEAEALVAWEGWGGLLNEGGYLCLEVSSEAEEPSEISPELELAMTRAYGASGIAIFRRIATV